MRKLGNRILSSCSRYVYRNHLLAGLTSVKNKGYRGLCTVCRFGRGWWHCPWLGKHWLGWHHLWRTVRWQWCCISWHRVHWIPVRKSVSISILLGILNLRCSTRYSYCPIHGRYWSLHSYACNIHSGRVCGKYLMRMSKGWCQIRGSLHRWRCPCFG